MAVKSFITLATGRQQGRQDVVRSHHQQTGKASGANPITLFMAVINSV
jgi:hypothetical protein